MSAHAVRVAVVRRSDGALPHPRLDDCGLDVVAEVQSVSDLLRAPVVDYEVALVGATRAQASDDLFTARLQRLGRIRRTVLVPTTVTRSSAALAASARVAGLVGAGCTPAELARTVRAISRGRIAYAADAIALLLRLVPPTARPAPALARTECSSAADPRGARAVTRPAVPILR